jgi:hypothetical protein
MYVIGEGAAGFDERVTAWEYAWQIKVTDDDVRFYVKPASLTKRETWEEMRAEAFATGRRLIILDTFSSLAPDADETKDAPMFTRRLSDLAAAIDGTAVAIHHPGWGDADRTRGGYQLEANVDEVLRLAGSASSDVAELTRKKVKDGAAGARIWLRRRIVPLGINEQGRPISSMVIESANVGDRDVRGVEAGETVLRDTWSPGAVVPGAKICEVLIERLSVSRPTAYRHVTRLLEAGVIRRSGGTDARPLYVLAEQ